MIDLTTVPTPELVEIRKILKYGIKAYASKTENAELKNLKYENAELKKINERRPILSDIGINIEDDVTYWLSLDDTTFDFVVGKMANIVNQTTAEKTRSVRVPALISQHELNTLDHTGYNIVREGLARRRGD
jgi:hypothetical protein